MKKTRNPMAGRHAVGQQTARLGSIRGGQSVSARPITASRNPQRPVAPVRTDSADTSRDIERIISRPENQLSNPYGVVRVPAPANQNYSQKAGLPAKGIRGSSHGGYEITDVGCANTRTTDDMLAAVGEPRRPQGYNDVNYFRGGGKKQAGRPGNPSRNATPKENARVRQTGY